MASVSGPVLIGVIPNLMGGEGHILPYHHSVQAAAGMLGWEYQAWVPADGGETAQGLRARPVLASVDLEAEGGLGDKLGRIPQAMQWGKTLADELQALTMALEGDRRIILLLERFIHLQLLGVWWGLRQMPRHQRDKIDLWILYRRDVHRDQTRGIYRWLQRRLTTVLAGRVRCLTDSDPLGRSLQSYFQQPFTVMPIPHTDFPALMPLPSHPDPIVCWWPGSPRPEKGLFILQSLVQTPYAQRPAIELVVAQAAQLTTQPGGMTVRAIGDRLSREEYSDWLNQSQVILLPYDPVAYRERTSGIFTETIIAGRLPVVSAGTWMAEELERYGLGDLILDWHDPLTVWRSLPEKLNDPEIRRKLDTMAQKYREFHTLTHYAEIMQTLAPASR